VVLNDQRAPIERGELNEEIELVGGGHDPAIFERAELIVLSPGVPKLAVVDEAIARGVPVTGEIELASTLVYAPTLAITGTNGKSTVTALTGALLAGNGKPTFVGGNLGTPLADAIGTPAVGEDGQVVVELSSYQLETCETFHPRGAALLNLTPDHLDRYASIEAYGEAKLRIAQRLDARDVLVYNGDDVFFRAAVARFTAPQRRSFSVRGRDADGFVDGDHLVLRLDREERYPIASLQLIGRHNLANVLAALLLVRATGMATFEQALAGLATFTALPHRMQLVGSPRGVRYYDDSKATNVDSVVAGIDGFPVPFVLIAGGRDKGGSYAPLVEALARNRCTRVLLIGEAAPLIERALGTVIPSERCATLQEAVTRGASIAQPGEAVVLSPACSSFDMFDNYAHRGAAFRAAVESLPPKVTA
jgi:UDP-N-acetylmuramoylalanine--D-glutamate ligase